MQEKLENDNFCLLSVVCTVFMPTQGWRDGGDHKCLKIAYIIYEWPLSSEGSEDVSEANNHATSQNCSSVNPPNKWDELDEQSQFQSDFFMYM